MRLRYFLLPIFISTITACGGGGGGGAPAPANLQPTDPGVVTPEPEQLVSGVFTDSPVTGLRYTQGHREGYTSDGVFKYNTKSTDPVCFYIGAVLLGCADGSNVVTPYNLATAGNPASLQSGYNISRLLISLDDSTANGIQLSEATRGAQGTADFYMADGLFEVDEVVSDLIAKYSPQGALVTRSEVEAHLLSNSDVQQAIQNITQSVSQAISSVRITWDSSLAGAGILAHVEAKVAGSVGTSEHLYLELDSHNNGLYLSRITYANVSGEYTSVQMNSDGVPVQLNRDGKTYSFTNVSDYSMSNWIATSAYRPVLSAYMVAQQGTAPSMKTRHISDARAQELVDIVASLSTTGLSDEAVLRISASSAAIINSARCAGQNNSACDTNLEDALVYALGDLGYQQALISWDYSPLSYDLCVPVKMGTVDQKCGVAPSLSQFNLVVEQSYQGGAERWQNSTSDRNALIFQMVEQVGDRLALYEKWCEVDAELKRLDENTLYYSHRVKPGSCQVTNDEYSGREGVQCYWVSNGENCDARDIALPVSWTAKKALSEKIFDQFVKSRFGVVLEKLNPQSYGYQYHEVVVPVGDEAGTSWLDVYLKLIGQYSRAAQTNGAEIYIDAQSGFRADITQCTDAFGGGNPGYFLHFTDVWFDRSSDYPFFGARIYGEYLDASGTELSHSIAIQTELSRI